MTALETIWTCDHTFTDPQYGKDHRGDTYELQQCEYCGATWILNLVDPAETTATLLTALAVSAEHTA